MIFEGHIVWMAHIQDSKPEFSDAGACGVVSILRSLYTHCILPLKLYRNSVTDWELMSTAPESFSACGLETLKGRMLR